MTATQFFTLGLPRSRSRWLTHLLNTEYSDCYHEKLSAFGWNTIPLSNKQYVGSCDTNPLNLIPRSPLVIIENDVNTVIESMLKAFDNPFVDKPFRPFVTGLINKYKESLDKWKGLRVSVDDLNDRNNLIDIIKFLKPEEKIDERYVALMLNSRITVKERDLIEGINNMASVGYNTDLNGLYDIIKEK